MKPLALLLGGAMLALGASSAQSDDARRADLLARLENLRADRVARVAVCPDGRRFTLGVARPAVQTKLSVSPRLAPRGFVQVQRPGTRTLTVFALVNGDPRALACAEVDGRPAVFVVSDADDGVRVTRLNADTRDLDWEVTAARGDVQAVDLVVNDRGHPFVLSEVRGDLSGTTDTGGRDVLVQRLDARGTPQWTTRIGSSGEDRPARLALQGRSALWIAGSTDGNFAAPNTGGQDGFLARLESGLGTLGAVTQFGTPENDIVSALLAAPQGVWLAGHTYGALGGPNAGEADAFLAGFTNLAQRRWTRQFGGPAADVFTSLARLGGNRVLAVGFSDPATPEAARGAVLRTVDAQGETVDEARVNLGASASPMDVGVHADGTVTLAGRAGDGALFALLDAAFHPTLALLFDRVEEHLDAP